MSLSQEPRELTKHDFIVGLPLVPQRLGNKSNAIITKVVNDGVVIVTDFGNEVFYTKTEAAGEYFIPYWAEEHMMYYGADLDPQQALRERFEKQIELLQEQLGKLDASAQ